MLQLSPSSTIWAKTIEVSYKFVVMPDVFIGKDTLNGRENFK